MKNIIIRKAAILDLDEILRLNLSLFKKEYREFDKSLDMTWTQGRIGRTYFSDRISSNDGFVLVVARNDKIVGYLCGGLSVRNCRIKAKHAELENMLIENKYRGLGIGKQLGRAFLEWCEKKKVKYVTVTASSRNTQGLGLYKSLGFKDYDVTLQIENKLN